MVEERRQHQRLVPNAPLFISLDDSKSGLLLDLCEGGLAVASLVPRNLDEVVSLAFDLPQGVGRVETQARIAWTRDAGHLTGVHFVDLDQDSQRQLTEWISAEANFTAAADQEPAEPVFVTRSSYAQVDPILQESRDMASAVPPTTLFPATIEPEPEKSEPVEAGGRERGIKSRYGRCVVVVGAGFSWISNGERGGEAADAGSDGGPEGNRDFGTCGPRTGGRSVDVGPCVDDSAHASSRDDPNASANLNPGPGDDASFETDIDPDFSFEIDIDTRNLLDGLRRSAASGSDEAGRQCFSNGAGLVEAEISSRRIPARQ
jgi:hypothetical protein